MSACRLIQSRAQRPTGLAATSKPSNRQNVAIVRAVRSDQPVDTYTQPAQSDGMTYESPPAYPLYQPQPYQQAAPITPVPQPPPAPAAESGGTPFWVWILVGAAGAWVWGKIQEFRSNPAAAMLGMMGSMNKSSSAPAGGNDMAAMMEMMKKMQGAPGAGGAPGFGGQSPYGGMGSPGMTIPTTAQEVPTSGRDGSKFEQNKQAATPASAAEPTSTQSQPASAAAAANATPDLSTKSSSSTAGSFFADAGPSANSTSASAPTSSSAGTSSPSSFFSDSGTKTTSAASSGETGEGTEKLIENMLEMVVNNPELQQQMNKFLPENMRNESTWKWIASNPELRKQIASQMAPNFNMSDFQNMPGATTDVGANVDMKEVTIRQPRFLPCFQISARYATSFCPSEYPVGSKIPSTSTHPIRSALSVVLFITRWLAIILHARDETCCCRNLDMCHLKIVSQGSCSSQCTSAGISGAYTARNMFLQTCPSTNWHKCAWCAVLCTGEVSVSGPCTCILCTSRYPDRSQKSGPQVMTPACPD